MVREAMLQQLESSVQPMRWKRRQGKSSCGGPCRKKCGRRVSSVRQGVRPADATVSRSAGLLFQGSLQEKTAGHNYMLTIGEPVPDFDQVS